MFSQNSEMTVLNIYIYIYILRAIPAKNISGREGTFFLIQAPIQLHLPLMPPPIKLNFPPTPSPIQLRKQQSPTQEFILVLGKVKARICCQ